MHVLAVGCSRSYWFREGGELKSTLTDRHNLSVHSRDTSHEQGLGKSARYPNARCFQATYLSWWAVLNTFRGLRGVTYNTLNQ